MVESQTCFEIKNVGANLKKEHKVFNLIYLIDIFAEFYPAFFRKKSNKGKPIKYHPRELLTYVLWGLNNNKESYRELEQWCDNNDESCQLVLNCKTPGKDVINRFKNNHLDIINAFDQFLIDFASALGLIDGKIVYADGTILKAWCNTFKKMYPEEIQYLKNFMQKNIKNKKLWKKLQIYYATDETNEELKKELKPILDKLHYNLNINGIHLLKLSLISSKNFKTVLERIELMEDNITGENSISIVDPESRHMPDKKGNMGLNYNYQTVTDNKYGFRLAHYITNESNDKKEAKKIVDLTAEKLHTDEFTICFDNGYWDEDILKEIYKGNTRVVIPYKTDATRNKQKYKNKNKSGKRQELEKQKNNQTRIKKYEFQYIGEKDAFECPKTKELLKMVGIVTISGSKMKKYTTDYCLKCELKNECTSQYRRIIYEPYDPVIEEIRQLYYSKEGKEIYSLRGHHAETSFALLLEIRNHRGIKTKGLEKVNNEMTLHEIHHNIKKFEKHTTNEFLKSILKHIKEYKNQHEKINFISLEEIYEKLIIENNIIRGIRKGKKYTQQKKNKTTQSRL